MDTEHLFMLPNIWLECQQYADFNVDITQNFYNAYCTQKSFSLRNISIVGVPKSTFLIIIFRAFMWLLPLSNALPRIIIHLQCFEMVSQRRRDCLIKAWWAMELLCRLLILKWHPRKIKLPFHVWKKLTFIVILLNTGWCTV